jgi:hypothetical protein
MKTITFLEQQYEASIEDGDILLWNIAEGIEQEVILRGAARQLEIKADIAATEFFEDPDERGSTAYHIDESLKAEYIENNIEDYCHTWVVNGNKVEVINYNLN